MSHSSSTHRFTMFLLLSITWRQHYALQSRYLVSLSLSFSLGCPPCRCHCASHSRSLMPMPLCLPVTFSYHSLSLSLSPGPSLCHTSMTLTESKPLTLSHGPMLMMLSLIVMLFDLSLLVVHHVDVVVPHT